MSYQHVQYAMDRSTPDLKPHEVLVLVALAEHANITTGLSFPSVATICSKTRMSRRAVQICIRSLIMHGELSVATNGGGSKATAYKFPGYLRTTCAAHGVRSAPQCADQRTTCAPPAHHVRPNRNGTITEPTRRDDLEAELLKAGITPTQSKSLISLPHMTPEYVRDVAKAVAARDDVKNPAAYMFRCLKDGVDASTLAPAAIKPPDPEPVLNAEFSRQRRERWAFLRDRWHSLTEADRDARIAACRGHESNALLQFEREMIRRSEVSV